MLTESDQKELLEFTATSPVLSVYLNTDPSAGNADAYRLRLRNMMKEVNLPQDIEAIERYFKTEYNWSGRGVAVFSCAPQGFFRAYPLAVPVRDMIAAGDRPAIKPLADLRDSFGGYGVVLVDKQGARVFSFHLGQLTEQEGVLGEAVKHTKQGGASTRPGSRGGVAGQTHYVEEVIERNMKAAVDFAVRFFEINHVRRVLIGGTDENVALFKSLLPKAWQSLVVGTFPMSMTASHIDVLGKALQAGRDAETLRIDRLVERVISGASQGGSGVVGLADTLSSLNDGRVQTLVVLDGFETPVYRCVSCGRMTHEKRLTCAVCEGQIEMFPDGVELATSVALRTGGDVQTVCESPALLEAGSIGATLRY